MRLEGPSLAGKIGGLAGGGNGEETAPGAARRKQIPPLWAGVSLYSAQGAQYAPAFPDGVVVGMEDS